MRGFQRQHTLAGVPASMARRPAGPQHDCGYMTPARLTCHPLHVDAARHKLHVSRSGGFLAPLAARLRCSLWMRVPGITGGRLCEQWASVMRRVDEAQLPPTPHSPRRRLRRQPAAVLLQCPRLLRLLRQLRQLLLPAAEPACPCRAAWSPCPTAAAAELRAAGWRLGRVQRVQVAARGLQRTNIGRVKQTAPHVMSARLCVQTTHGAHAQSRRTQHGTACADTHVCWPAG
jgi:hypothetical protein